MHDHHQPVCESCPVENCPTGGSPDPDAPRGWRLVGMSIVFFVMPLVLALVGSTLFSETGTGQFLGGAAGLAAGILGCGLISKLTRGNPRICNEQA